MRINVKKTKILLCGRENRTRVQIKIRNQIIERVDEFTCLGSAISNDGRNRSEKIKRIYQVKIAFNNKKTIFRSKSMSLKTRKTLLMTYAWTTEHCPIWVCILDNKHGRKKKI